MTQMNEDHLPEEDFEPVDLGSVSAETKGEFKQPAELAGSPNSRQDIG